MMGILGMIREKKEQFHNATVQRRKQVILKKTEKIRADNLRQDELLKARQEYEEARVINEQLRAGSPTPPGKLQKFGMGLKATLDKKKAEKTRKVKVVKGKTVRVSAPPSSGSRGLEFGSNSDSSRFGGQRPLDVGGSGSPFSNQGRRIF